jgi:hypothetical protein
MGYSIDLIDRNKSITQEVLDDCVKQLPTRLFVDGKDRKHLWTDIRICENPKKISFLCISGSFSISGEWALDMTVSFQQILRRKGYDIEIFSHDFGYVNIELYKWMGYSVKELEKCEKFPHGGK